MIVWGTEEANHYHRHKKHKDVSWWIDVTSFKQDIWCLFSVFLKGLRGVEIIKHKKCYWLSEEILENVVVID